MTCFAQVPSLTHPIQFVVEPTGIADGVSCLCSSPENSLGGATVGTLVVHTLQSGFLRRWEKGREGGNKERRKRGERGRERRKGGRKQRKEGKKRERKWAERDEPREGREKEERREGGGGGRW